MTDEEVDTLLRADAPHSPAEHPDVAQLAAFARRALRDEERSTIEAHLARCTDCRNLTLDLSEPMPAHLRRFGVDSLASPRRSWRWPAAAAVAAAILAAVLTIPQDGQRFDYALEGPFGAEKQMRGSGASTDVFESDNIVELRLTPAKAVAPEDVDLAVFVEGPSGAISAGPRSSLTETKLGAFRYRARASVLFHEGSGTYVVHAFVGSEREWPTTSANIEALREALGDIEHLHTRVRYRANEEVP